MLMTRNKKENSICTHLVASTIVICNRKYCKSKAKLSCPNRPAVNHRNFKFLSI